MVSFVSAEKTKECLCEIEKRRRIHLQCMNLLYYTIQQFLSPVEWDTHELLDPSCCEYDLQWPKENTEVNRHNQ